MEDAVDAVEQAFDGAWGGLRNVGLCGSRLACIFATEIRATLPVRVWSAVHKVRGIVATLRLLGLDGASQHRLGSRLATDWSATGSLAIARPRFQEHGSATCQTRLELRYSCVAGSTMAISHSISMICLRLSWSSWARRTLVNR